jgi:amidase
VHADHRAAAVGAAARLRAAPGGAAVTLADPPYPRTLGLAWSRRWQAGVAQDATALDVDLDAVERRTAAVARRGRRALRFAPPREAAMAGWRDRVLEWFDVGGYDVLVGPATARPPVAAGALAGRCYRATLARSAWRLPFTQAWNLAGLPAVVAPVRIGGRPVGVQLVGRPGAESALLSAAARLEQRVVPMAGAAPKRIYV